MQLHNQVQCMLSVELGVVLVVLLVLAEWEAMILGFAGIPEHLRTHS